MNVKLSIKQKQFCENYLINNGNATQAAIAAGYSKESARSISCEILKKQEIIDYIDYISKPEPEQIVLKWTEFKKITKSTHPKNHSNVLVVTRNNNYFTCFFSKISSNSMDFYLLSPKSETEDEVIDNVVYWIPLPSAPRNEYEIDDEYLIEQTALETFDIIDAITPALRDAVKHLLVQQGANK